MLVFDPRLSDLGLSLAFEGQWEEYLIDERTLQLSDQIAGQLSF